MKHFYQGLAKSFLKATCPFKKNLLPISIVISFFLCGALSASAHKISIKGAVYGKNTNTPLAGATVKLVNTPKISTTDNFGVYIFTDLADGPYELQISYLGYEQSRASVEVSSSSPAKVVTHLEPGNLQLSEIAVSAAQEKPLNIISAVDLQMRPIQNSQEILRFIPGLVMAQHAGGGKAEQIFLRGFDIDHGTDINLTADGMPVNMVSHAHGQGYSDLHFLIPETIQAVDFGKGPYQANKGNFATAGYADFRTRPALDKNSIKLEAGRFDNYRAVGMFNLLGPAARQNHQNAYVAAEYLFSNGYFDLPQNLDRFNVLGRYQGIINDKTIINASLSAFRSNWGASGQIPERAVKQGLINRFGAIDSSEGGNTARYNATISLERMLAHEATIKNQVYLIKYDFDLYSNFTLFLNDPIHGDEIRQRESRTIYGYQGNYEKEFTFLGKPVRSDVGIGLRYDDVNGSELSRTQNRTYLSTAQKGNTNEANAFAYLSETWELSPRLTVNAALRFDQFYFRYQNLLPTDTLSALLKTQRHRLSPKFNITYAVSPSVQLYLNTGQGFHSNDARVSVLPNHREILPKATGADLGITFKPFNRLFINGALWFLDLEQEFVYVGDEGVVEPSGKTRRFGVDVSARYQLTDNLFADADVNLAKPRARNTEAGAYYIPLAPTTTSTGGFTYQTPNKFRGSLRYRYVADRAANEDYSLTASGYFLLDAVAAYTFKKLEFKISAENLLNQKWKEAQFETESQLRGEAEPVTEINFTPGTPFFIKAGITYSF
ncbi:TonB-dependent receptor [Adhaeribacter arboris]|uniref:TonB-dependent receptor n=1 Tax=Adhaeribacter arboris TaxID=2072846 RepID=A0A2T2YLH6_9BACT|nr:TonB-dependent receptor [Adhaeribacter arboris]PSR56373.1 TonB-dependent receptor [Adhaeribacter arboris]